MPRPQLVIIPGLGDRSGWYTFFAAVWWLRGYRSHIVTFGWEEQQEIFEQKFDFLMRYIDQLPGDNIYIIGVSAGGTAAVQALNARPNKVRKVVTVSSPYGIFVPVENRPLLSSLELLKEQLPQMPAELKARILSVHGWHDTRVRPQWSRADGIATTKVFAFGHGPSIFGALVLFSGRIKRFLGGDRAQ